MNTMNTGEKIPTRSAPRLVGPLLIVAVFLTLCVMTWQRWTDPVVDFGRELYTAWQVSVGKTLYREVEHLYGPLSAQINALAFRLFGVSYRVLTVTSLVLLAGFTLLLYRAWKRLTNDWTATWVCVGFLAVSAFALYKTDIANYNFVTPYSFELVHGFYLALLCLMVLTAYAQTPRRLYLWLAGLLYGLVFLTKLEVLVALTIAIAAFVLGGALCRRLSLKSVFHLCGHLLAGVVMATALLYLATGLSLSPWQYIEAVSRQYLIGLNPQVNQLLFYRQLLGFDAPWAHLHDGLQAAAVIGLILFLFHGLSRWHQSASAHGHRVRCQLIATIGVGLAGASFLWDWHYAACLLPPVLALALCLEWVGSRRRRRQRAPGTAEDPAVWTETAGWLLWLGFGLGMLLKTGLNPLFIHYGFGLSAAGLMGLIAILTFRLPRLYPETVRPLMRLWFTALALTGILRLANESREVCAMRPYRVGPRAQDRFLTFAPPGDPRGRLVNDVSAWLAAEWPPAATLAVVPEGVMLNYLSRRVNPTPYINFIPVTLAVYGEDRMLSAFQATPPDCLVFFDRDMSEYGLPPFGSQGSPGALFMKWVETDYVAVKTFSRSPLVVAYRRRNVASSGRVGLPPSVVR